MSRAGYHLSYIVCMFLLMAVTSGCDFVSCENEVLQAVSSPDKSLKVVVFNRDCGATTGFNSQIAILKADSKLPKHASVDSFFSLKGQPALEILWLTGTEVKIRYESGSEVLRKVSPTASVAVIYEEVAPGALKPH